VSTGGFTTEAKYEAERSSVPLTLVDSDDLVELLVQYYETTDSETRTLVPLRKTYWPA
jgi:restriction system protein